MFSSVPRASCDACELQALLTVSAGGRLRLCLVMFAKAPRTGYDPSKLQTLLTEAAACSLIGRRVRGGLLVAALASLLDFFGLLTMFGWLGLDGGLSWLGLIGLLSLCMTGLLSALDGGLRWKPPPLPLSTLSPLRFVLLSSESLNRL